jgi:hypothetical protein
VKFGNLPEAALKRGEEVRFLKAIKKQDDRPAVSEIDRRKFAIPSPSPSSRTDPFEPKEKTSHK